MTKQYLLHAVASFPSAAIQSTRSFGIKGLYLALCTFIFRRVPASIKLKNYGIIGTLPEATNFVDNFCMGELRSKTVESALQATPNPWIIDIGVNVGLSIRWWFSLQRQVNVIGVDMFQESLDFTTNRLCSAGLPDQQWHPVCGAVGDSPGVLTVRYDNPLEGTNNTFTATGSTARTMKVDLLDRWLEAYCTQDIFLLKIDIEGAGGLALQGAGDILKRTRFVVMETHSESEVRLASQVLASSGFSLFRIHGRSTWWEADRASSQTSLLSAERP